MALGLKERAHALYGRLGALACMAIAFCTVAAVLHFASGLPAHYRFDEPFLTLKNVLQQPYIPLTVVLAYALGMSTRTEDVRASALASWNALRTPLGLLRAAAVLILVIATDAFVLEARRTLPDLAALCCIAAVVSLHRPGRDKWRKQLAYFAVAVTLFSASCYAFTIFKALTFVSGRSFDQAIMSAETALFGAPPHRWIGPWVSQRPFWAELCDWAYFRFFDHMTLTAVFLAAVRRPAERTRYLGALAICYFLGGPLYHLWPAAGPGYVEASYFRLLREGPPVTMHIHAWLAANTAEVMSGTAAEVHSWGYVACMPSLHIAHETIMLYYARFSRVAFGMSSVFLAITLLAVVALGFHYPLDLLAGALLGLVSIRLARRFDDYLMPRGLEDDEESARERRM